MTSIEELINLLNLEPHPIEGGFFAETYRSRDVLAPGTVPDRYSGSRSCGTAIYYLLTSDTRSALHRLLTDEVFHFYLGDPVEMLQLHPGGSAAVFKLGVDVAAGMRPQVVVPRGVWQGARLFPGGRFALLGTTMAPGFDAADYEPGGIELVQAYPEHRDLIRRLLP